MRWRQITSGIGPYTVLYDLVPIAYLKTAMAVSRVDERHAVRGYGSAPHAVAQYESARDIIWACR